MNSGRGPFRAHVGQWQQRMRPPQSNNPFAKLVGWLLFGFLLVVGLMVGIVLLLVGWILLLPMLWRRRKSVKQAWQFSRAAQQQQKQQQQQYQRERDDTSRNSQDGGATIEGEYEVKQDSNKHND